MPGPKATAQPGLNAPLDTCGQGLLVLCKANIDGSDITRSELGSDAQCYHLFRSLPPVRCSVGFLSTLTTKGIFDS